MNNRWFPMLMIALCLFTACADSDDPAIRRARQIEHSAADITVGAVAPWSQIDGRLWEGIQLAVDEFNAAGGLAGRRLHIIKRDDRASVEMGCRIAQSFAADPTVAAIIGHYESFTTLPASIIYQYNGILMLSTVCTNPWLTQRGLDLVFRSVPDDHAYADVLTAYCRKYSLERIFIYYDRNEYGRSLDIPFEIAAQTAGLQIVSRQGYDKLTTQAEFMAKLDRWQTMFPFDAILIAGRLPQAGKIIQALSRLGIEKTILGGLALDRTSFLQSLDAVPGPLVIPSSFDAEDSQASVARFVRNFQSHYQTMPDALAAQGYDTVRALVCALRHAQAPSPPQMAKALRAAQQIQGVAGSFAFDQWGNWTGQGIYLKKIVNGKMTKIVP